jgi:GMP synthase (glutamine-hydrolysing)
METKILAIQFRGDAASLKQERDCLRREVGQFADLDFINAATDPIDWADVELIMSGYHGVILCGSGEFYFDGNKPKSDPARKATYEILEKLSPLFSYLFEHDIPTLGICFGHQLLGAFRGAKVRYDIKQHKTCSHEIRIMVDKNNHFLFSDLPDSFHAYYGHKDSLDRVPEGAELMMDGGERCKVPALKYSENIYTTQFHPELNFEDMVVRMKNSCDYLPKGTDPNKVFRDDSRSSAIVRNFSKLVSQHKDQKDH